MDSHIVIRVGLGSGLRDRYVQDERYFAMEHRDVRREAYEWPPVC